MINLFKASGIEIFGFKVYKILLVLPFIPLAKVMKVFLPEFVVLPVKQRSISFSK